MKSKFLIYIFITLNLIFNLSCSESSGDNYSSYFPNSTASNYFKRSTSITIEIHYEDGAEPYVGDINTALGPEPLWNITEDNIIELFSARTVTPTITVPKILAEMNIIPDQNKTSWTPNDAVELYERHHNLTATQTEAVFYIYFVKGNSSSGTTTIAFSVNTTPVIIVFKDVITSASMSDAVRRFIEQSTIVHELGHAFGLVNNGIPMATDHQDVEHGAHTTNSNCVMYFQNEGIADLQEFYADYFATGDGTLWGPEVLADAFAFSD